MLGYLWHVMHHLSAEDEVRKNREERDKVYQLWLSQSESSTRRFTADAASNLGRKGRRHRAPELLMTLTEKQMENMRHFVEEHDPDSLSNLCRMDEIERECIELRREVEQKRADLQRLTREMDAEKERFEELVAEHEDTVSQLRGDLVAKDAQISELVAIHNGHDDADGDDEEEDSDSKADESDSKQEVIENVQIEEDDDEPVRRGKTVFVRCRRVATDIYDDLDERTPRQGPPTMSRIGEASVTVSNLSLNMSRDSESDTDTDSECESGDYTPDGYGNGTTSKRRCPSLDLSHLTSNIKNSTGSALRRPSSAPFRSSLTVSKVAMFSDEVGSHRPTAGHGKLRRLSLCSNSTASDVDDDHFDIEYPNETADGRPASARFAPLSSSSDGSGSGCSQSACGSPSRQNILFPELTYSQMDALQLSDEVDDMDSKADIAMEAVEATRGGPAVSADSEGVRDDKIFDGEFPTILKIEIDGNWFNKKARAVIEWRGDTFKRKMADFKWLSRMLLLNTSDDRVAPEYPEEIPSALWRRGYLNKRKKELNLYLMQCHSMPWIRRYRVYRDVFLETDKKTWKQKRNRFNRNMMQRIKENRVTYRPDLDVVVGTSSDDEFILMTDDEDEMKQSVVTAAAAEEEEKKMERTKSMPASW